MFIYYIDTVNTRFTEYNTFKGNYVDTVYTVELQCKSQYKVFKLHRTSNKVLKLEQNSNK